MRFPVVHASCMVLSLVIARPGWAQSVESLGDLAGGTGSSGALGISADGSAVVGYGYTDPIPDWQAFRWTEAGGMVGLGYLPGGSISWANAVSADGSVVVGYSDSTPGRQAFRWTEAGGMVGLGDLAGGGFESESYGVSADGSVVVGYGTNADNNHEAFRWTQADGMVDLGDLAGGGFYSEARGVSADGSVVVGHGTNADDDQEAFRWTDADGMVGLGFLPGGVAHSTASGVSADGSVVVGYALVAGGSFEAFRWTDASGMVGLGDLPGGLTNSQAQGISADGKVIVGSSNTDDGSEAFRWTEADGMESIADVLTAAGIDLTGWRLEAANGANEDGSLIVGNGTKDGDDVGFLASMGADEADPGEATPEEPGVTTPEDLARSLVAATVPSQQSQQAMTTGLDQSLFAARHAAAAPPPPRQVASADPNAVWLPAPARWSAYAVGSLGVGQDNDSGNWGLNGATGLLTELAPGVHVGAGVIGAHGETELDLDGESRLGAIGGSVIASYEASDGLRLYGSAFAAHLDVETDRHYRNGAAIDGSRGETDGIGYGVAVRGGWEVPVRIDTSVMPYAELRWTKTRLDAYEEEGGAFPAQFSDQTAHELTSRLGLEVSHRLTPALEVQARAAWAHRLDGDGGSLTATTLGLTQTLSPTQGDRNWAEGAVAAVWKVTDATTVMAEIGGRTGRTPEPAVT
ncbi:MAG TPA: autotransporter domain-containing protein, partial [Alphaproteobacteria bacterium]|nr:autotransporter domain-containing protein [Alphaproteobacteria bacterium]